MLESFHTAVAGWFARAFRAPTAPQLQAWPAIRSGQHALIAAPTGSGKTLAAFLAAIDDLVRQAVEGRLEETTQVVYVSPLKALSNDIQRNLQLPLSGISEELLRLGLPAPEIRALVRTGDTDQSARAAMRRRPPHILVTTPESLYLLLTSESGRRMLASTRSVIVDEIHAVAGTKRGSHLALSLERLGALCARPVQRIGLSATQKPIEDVARFLVGGGGVGEDGGSYPHFPGMPLRSGSSQAGESNDAGARISGAPGDGEMWITPAVLSDAAANADQNCVIVDSGHVRQRDLELALPDAPLEAVMSAEVWQNIYDQLALLANAHRTALVFANTRRMVERVTRHLSERLGEAQVAAHHGSLSKEQRLDAEQRLKSGQLKVLVATASLELGIDIGDVDLVCQLGTPRSISALLQRVGRANHGITGVPKGRLFPLSRDELVECAALLDAVRRGELDRLKIPRQPLDVLAQQIVAEVASREYGEDELYALVCRAWPYRELRREDFDALVRVLAEGYSTRRGRRSAYLHRDAVNKRLRPRKGARLTAITCGGAIPDAADYQVVLEPAGTFIGTLNEDFAIESMAGDIFQLGNSSYRIQRVEAGKVRVEDAKGLPPTIPFWLGEAPARTDELSMAVSRLRAEVESVLPGHSSSAASELARDDAGEALSGGSAREPDTAPARDAVAAAVHWLMSERGLGRVAAEQIAEYLAAAKAMLGELPKQDVLVLERFFDEAGGMQLVIHSPFGARINRAFGLALRKRFCRAFNFELQAAATEDAIVLSLGETHSFELESVAKYLNSRTVKDVLVQAVLDAPLFTTRWRWNASISLAVRRSQGGKKTPAPLQRMMAEDLIAVVFPDQLACAENLTGEREVPDHPLVNQTLDDCLHEAMDVDGLIALLEGIERGERRVLARDLPHPSPLAQEILNARPYAFLDDAPLEERRTQAVASRRWLDPQTADEFGRLDPAAIARVREEAWPSVDSADELHDALVSVGYLTAAEGAPGWQAHFDALMADRRATRLCVGPIGEGMVFWCAVEQLPQLLAVLSDARLDPVVEVPPDYASRQWSREEALVELIRARLQGVGPATVTALAESLCVERTAVEQALIALESEGFALRGRFTPEPAETEWCERRLLARIHRYTIKTLRAEIEPVSAADFMRFLLQWQGVTRDPRLQGVDALAAVIEQLEGYEAAAVSWEADILPARLQDYDRAWLDQLCLAGRVLWTRLTPPKTATAAPVRATPISLLTRRNWPLWQSLSSFPASSTDASPPGGGAGVSRQTDGVVSHPEPAREAGHMRLEADPGETKSRLFHPARSIATFLQTHGASFFDEILGGAGLLKAQAEDGLGELVACGIASSDSFNGLRGLLVPAERKRRLASRRRYVAQFGMENAGRWTLVRRQPEAAQTAQAAQVEQIVWILLRRYGVIFKRLLAREADWLPPWYQLLRACRRLEAQGLIRGGRFVAGFTGEQYALPDAVGALRGVRKQAAEESFVSICAADPLNLVGIVTPGARVPALASNRILLRAGVPVAVYIGGETRFLAAFDPAAEWAARNALLRQKTGMRLATPPQ